MAEKVICPYCGSKMQAEYNREHAWMQCHECFSTSPKVKIELKRGRPTPEAIKKRIEYIEKMAASAALHRAEPQNRVLTLEEVRGMSGVPVWCEIPSDNPQYGIVCTQKNGVFLVCGHLQFKYYGEWRCWLHKPTDEERASVPWEV